MIECTVFPMPSRNNTNTKHKQFTIKQEEPVIPDKQMLFEDIFRLASVRLNMELLQVHRNHHQQTDDTTTIPTSKQVNNIRRHLANSRQNQVQHQQKPLDLSVKRGSIDLNNNSTSSSSSITNNSEGNRLESNHTIEDQTLIIASTNAKHLITGSTSPSSSASSQSSSAFQQVPQQADVIISSTNGRSQARQKKHKGRSHLCHHCGRLFSRSDMLTRHSRLHSGLKPYQCGKCKQVFSRSDHLSTHERTHTGEKPYQCEFCSYSACRRDMITRHMRIHGIRSNVKQHVV